MAVNPKQKMYLITALIVFAVVFVTYHFIKDGSSLQDQFDDMSDEEQIGEIDGGIDFNVTAEEIKFTKTILFHRGQYSADGGELKSLPCTNTRKTIAFFYLDGAKDKAVISCTDEYMGGASLSYEDKSGQVADLEIAQQEGDAGDIWETRSLLTRDEKGLRVAKVTLTESSEESLESETAPAKVICSEHRVQYQWNLKDKKFEEVPYTDSFGLKDFTRPTIDSCLNADGSLKK